MNNKKPIFIIIVMFLIIGGGVFLYSKLSSNYKIQNEEYENLENNKEKNEFKKAIDFTVYDEDGKKVNLSDFYEKPIVINFWASWCNPCKIEMPYFQKATNKYKDKVNILMVNLTDGMDETVESATKYIKENNFDMNVFFDKDLDAGYKYQLLSIPRTIFIDKDNNIVTDYIGTINEETLINNIENLLK